MATIKIKPIKSTLKKAIDYIINDEKTDYGINVYSDTLAPEYACREFEHIKKEWEMAGRASLNKTKPILAYHIIQSFPIKEKITEEKALELGREFAERYFNKNYKYVVATHNDKKNIHNHIIVNAYSHTGKRKYFSRPYKTISELRNLNDSICIENNLTIIDKNKETKKATSIEEIYASKRGASYKKILQLEIDMNIKISENYEEFLKLMKEKYDVKEDRKYISFRRKNTQERYTRAKTLGENYNEERIKERIQNKEREAEVVPEFTAVYNGKYKKLCKDREKIKKYEKLFTVIKEKNIRTINQLEEKIEIYELEESDMKKIIKKNEKKIELLSEVVNSLETYKKYADIYIRYKKNISKEYYEKHIREITLAEKSKKTLEKYGVSLTSEDKTIREKVEEIRKENIIYKGKMKKMNENICEMKEIKKYLKETDEKRNFGKIIRNKDIDR